MRFKTWWAATYTRDLSRSTRSGTNARRAFSTLSLPRVTPLQHRDYTCALRYCHPAVLPHTGRSGKSESRPTNATRSVARCSTTEVAPTWHRAKLVDIARGKALYCRMHSTPYYQNAEQLLHTSSVSMCRLRSVLEVLGLVGQRSPPRVGESF